MMISGTGKSRQFLWNIFYSFFAQSIALLLSVTVSLILPKALGVEDFGYWQLFLFYSSYLGLFHFGLNDGLYLKLGGEAYGNLDYRLIGSQFRLTFFTHSVLAALIILVSILAEPDPKRRIIWICVAAYLPIINATSFISYIFQAVNRIKEYSLIITIERTFIMLAVILLLVFGCDSFLGFVLVYMAGTLISLLFSIWKAREISLIRILPLRALLPVMGGNIAIGIKLLLSNLAGMLILGCGRFIVDRIWGISAFGKFSLSLSLTSVFLLFISQISTVLFPALRNTDELSQIRIYHFSRELIGLVFAGVFLAYMPLRYLLGLWLPQYEESLSYLALLLPLCTYDGKMNMLCSTYFKVMRKESLLLGINILSVGISILFSVISGYFLHSIYAVVLSMVIVIAFRSILSEIYLARLMGASVTKNIICETGLAVLFMTCTWFISPVGGFIIYLTAYAGYLVYKRKEVSSIWRSTRRYLHP